MPPLETPYTVRRQTLTIGGTRQIAAAGGFAVNEKLKIVGSVLIWPATAHGVTRQGNKIFFGECDRILINDVGNSASLHFSS
jgi:hypothetical protein